MNRRPRVLLVMTAWALILPACDVEEEGASGDDPGRAFGVFVLQHGCEG